MRFDPPYTAEMLGMLTLLVALLPLVTGHAPLRDNLHRRLHHQDTSGGEEVTALGTAALASPQLVSSAIKNALQASTNSSMANDVLSYSLPNNYAYKLGQIKPSTFNNHINYNYYNSNHNLSSTITSTNKSVPLTYNFDKYILNDKKITTRPVQTMRPLMWKGVPINNVPTEDIIDLLLSRERNQKETRISSNLETTTANPNSVFHLKTKINQELSSKNGNDGSGGIRDLYSRGVQINNIDRQLDTTHNIKNEISSRNFNKMLTKVNKPHISDTSDGTNNRKGNISETLRDHSSLKNDDKNVSGYNKKNTNQTENSEAATNDKQYDFVDAVAALKSLKAIDWHAIVNILHEKRGHGRVELTNTTLHDNITDSFNTNETLHDNISDSFNTNETLHDNISDSFNTNETLHDNISDSFNTNETLHDNNNVLNAHSNIDPIVDDDIYVCDEINILHDGDNTVNVNKRKNKCLRMREKSREISIYEDTFDTIEQSVPQNNGIRRNDNRNGNFRGQFKSFVEFNDRFLPVPLMKSSVQRREQDVLSALISVTNPFPYIMESANAMTQVFKNKMEPVMRMYTNNVQGVSSNTFVPVATPSSPTFQRSNLQNFAVSNPTHVQQNILNPVIKSTHAEQTFQQTTPLPIAIQRTLPPSRIMLPPSVPSTFTEKFPPFSLDQIVGKALEQSQRLEIDHNQFHVISTVTNSPNETPTNNLDNDGNKLINIKIPTPSGKYSIFEINLMANGHIGILPVNEHNFKSEIPTLTLENMMDATTAIINPIDEIHITETAARNIPTFVESPKKLESFAPPLQPHLINPMTDNQFSFSEPQRVRPFAPPFSQNANLKNTRNIPDVRSMKNDFITRAPSVNHFNPPINNFQSFNNPPIINRPAIPVSSTPTNEIFRFNNPQIHYQTNPLFYSSGISENEYLSPPPPVRITPTTPVSSTPINSISNGVDNSFGTDPNVYYIDITIPDSNGDAPLVQHGQGGQVRFKRSAVSSYPNNVRDRKHELSSNDGKQEILSEKSEFFSNSDNFGDKLSDLQPRIVQYNGWHPVNINDPLKNEPTVSYKAPPLQKVHFGIDPPSTKPLYPIVPENPSVYVVRKEKSNPEIDRVYGTENVEYLHIEPQTKTIKSFQPGENGRVLKFVKKLDFVKQSELRKRSHSNINDFFLPSENLPNFYLSNFNFSNEFKNNGVPDLEIAYSENQPNNIFSHPFLRILPRTSTDDIRYPNAANARGILPHNISPQQLMQARLNLARLPIMTPLRGLFGTYTQIPLGPTTNSPFSVLRDAAMQEVSPPVGNFDLKDHMVSQPSEPVGSVIFTRSQHGIDRSDISDYFTDEEDLYQINLPRTKTRFGNIPYKVRSPSKSITANRLSDLLQIFKYTNATEPPPVPTTTPSPVTIMKGFRYTKPTELPPTTTTTRPTTTKRFRLPTAFRYSVNTKSNTYIQNTLTTTPRSVISSRIRLVPTLTPLASKRVASIPDLIFDRVAETNSLDGYLFSDSEASPDYRRAEVQPKVSVSAGADSIKLLVVPKALSSKRVSIRLLNNKKENNEIVHSKNSQPLGSEFEVVYSKLPKITIPKAEKQPESPFIIVQGHSKVSVFRPDTSKMIPPKEVSFSSIQSTNLSNSPASIPTVSSITTPSTFISSDSTVLPKQYYNISEIKMKQPNNLTETDYINLPSYDYYSDNIRFDGTGSGPRIFHDYSDLDYDDIPTYTMRQPWVQVTNSASKPPQVSFIRLPSPRPDTVNDSAVTGRQFSEKRPPPPPLHFLEGLRQSSMPTSAVPTTWQDLDVEESKRSEIRIPSSKPLNTNIKSESVTQLESHDAEKMPIIVKDSPFIVTGFKEFHLQEENVKIRESLETESFSV